MKSIPNYTCSKIKVFYFMRSGLYKNSMRDTRKSCVSNLLFLFKLVNFHILSYVMQNLIYLTYMI